MSESSHCQPDLEGPDCTEDIVRPVSVPIDGKPIFLIGMMGAGKTTIGRILARYLGREFVDLDHALEAKCGVRISVIFEIEGEEGFRRRETAQLDECSLQQGIVLATGGGAVLAPENRQILKERGTVVYLRADAAELFRRLERDRSRPLLQTADPQARIRELLALREPIYEEAADLILDSGTMTAAQAARVLVNKLETIETLS